MREVLDDALAGAKYVLPTIAVWGVAFWAFGPVSLLVPVVGALLFCTCALVGIIVNA